MAKKRKSSQSGASKKATEDKASQVEDAAKLLEDPIAAEDMTLESGEITVEQLTKDADSDAVKAADKEPSDSKPIKELLSEIDAEGEAEAASEAFAKDEASAEEPAPAEPAPVAQPVPHDSPSNHVLLPAILGGLIAAAIGFGVAYYILPRPDPAMDANVAANAEALVGLRSEVATVSEATQNIDLSSVTGEITALREEITGEIGGLSEQLAVFDDRLLTLEKQPSGDGTLQEAALQAYQAELDELRAKVEDQASAAFEQLESTRVEAAAIEQAALDAARAAQMRAALAQVQTALNTGAPMVAPLEDLQAAMGDEALPAALTDVAEGVPTLSKLQADFPNAARLALADARAGGASGEETSAFGAFLREQLNVRSVAPREGDDADAILSRTQAAVSEGQLQAALDEIAGLPEAAQAKLSEWATLAQTRVDAVKSADEISLSLIGN